MTVVATLSGVLRLDDSDFVSGMQRNRNELNSFGQRIQTSGQNVQRFGRDMTVATAPIAAYLGAAAATTQTFNRNMSNVNAILGITGDEAAALRAELLAYGTDTVAGPLAVSDAYYAIVSGVADASTHMAILDAATRTSEAGQADLMATTSGLISVMNSYGFAADDAAFVSDVFTRTVQTGVLTMDELAAAFPQVTGLASQFNIGLDELGGSLAFLTTQGFSAGQSATFMRSMLTTVLNPTADLSAAISALGYDSGAALLEAEGLVGAYTLLSQQNGGLDGLITNSEALQGALALTNDEAAGFFDTYNSGIDGATDRAGAIQDQTEQWERLKSQVQGLTIQIGSALMPVLLTLVEDYIGPTITAVSAWIDENPELTGTIVLLTGALVVAGPIIAGVGTVISILGGIVSVATGLIALLTPAVTAAGAAFVASGGGVTGMGAALLAGLGPVGLMAIAIGGLVWWMSNREGGLMGSLLQAMITFNQLIAVIREANGAYLLFKETVSQNLNVEQKVGLAGVVTNVVGFFSGASNASTNTPPRAGGGEVSQGQSYVVGEREPEVFVPREPGTIYNQDQLAGMGGGMSVVVQAIYANSYEGGRAAADGLYARINELKRGQGIG
jgi:TP901 family phage tail tape measure protein